MSKALLTRLLVLEERQGQEQPRPALVGIRGVDGVIRASVPGQTEPEFFTDDHALEARADELGLRSILVLVIDGRRGAAVQEEAPCAA